MNKTNYTTQLQAGLGMIEETLHILDYYTPGINAAALGKTVLVNGGFQNITARRLRNSVEFNQNMHDRDIIFDNGWHIKIGRGLDIFQKPSTWYCIGASDVSYRPCLETKVDIFRS